VIQFRRLSILLLGAWLGASILTDVAVTQNFRTIERFLESPGDPATSTLLNQAGRARERIILRRNAGEENNWIFLNWERVELALGSGLFLMLLFGERPQKSLLAGAIVLLLIVLFEHFRFTPQITALGRTVDNLAPNSKDLKTFWILHGFYSGLDIVKMLVAAAMAARLAIRRKADKETFAREYEMAMGPSRKPGAGAGKRG
jgi:hypothetical protein